HSEWVASTFAAGVCASPVSERADCGGETRASYSAAHRASGQHREGAAVDAAQRYRDQWDWVLVMEFFAWRALQTRREVGGLAALTTPPCQSGESAREQGITKSGNRHVRWMTTELAWSWGWSHLRVP